MRAGWAIPVTARLRFEAMEPEFKEDPRSDGQCRRCFLVCLMLCHGGCEIGGKECGKAFTQRIGYDRARDRTGFAAAEQAAFRHKRLIGLVPFRRLHDH